MPHGKAKKVLEVIEASKDILAEIQPASVRAVCYRLLNARIIPSMEKKHTNRVGRHLVYARVQGLIPWEWIVDETREAERTPSWLNRKQFKRAVNNSWRLDPWPTQPCLVEVWSEKRTRRGTRAPVLKEYDVTFRVMHGYGSATEVHQVAVEREGDDRQLVILYVGDWDPSGMHMSEVDFPKRLQEYGADNIDLVRVALNENDVKRGDLPYLEAKESDTRYKWYVTRFGTEKCWELDALSPVRLWKRVESEIQRRIDWDPWERVNLGNRAVKASLTRHLDAWDASISRQAS